MRDSHGVLELVTHTPYSAQIVLTPGLKNCDIEAMADAVCCRCDTSDTSPNNGYLGPAQGFAPIRRRWGQNLICQVLENLEPE